MRQARRRTFQGQTMVYARHERFTKCVQAFKILVELFLCIANLFCRSRSIMGASRTPGSSVFSGIDYLGYTCLPIALLC